MIGSGLKKYAKENGMKVDAGVAYGSLGGFAATLSERAGTKQILFTTVFADPGQRMRLMDLIGQTELKKTYWVQSLEVQPQHILVVFTDGMGTMKKIRAFADWFLPLLREYGASPVEICTHCGNEITEGPWILIEGGAYHFHSACAEAVKNSIDAETTRRREEDTGSYGLGLLGALLGAALGAIAWALVLNLGYVASVVGLLIGWLAYKGYDLLHGKQGKGKVPVLILAVIFGVVLGTFASDAFTLVEMITGGELPGMSLTEIPQIIAILMAEDAEYRGAVLGNCAMGLLFAALGVWGILRQAGKETGDVQYQELH